MPNLKTLLPFLIILIGLTIESCSNQGPYEPPYYGAVGTVIGREYCRKDSTKDFWLITIYGSSSSRQQYGDTLTLNGIKYQNVIKSTGIPEKLRVAGEKIGFDFYISETALLTNNCSTDTARVYKLKVAEMVSCGQASF